jgi:BRCA1-associated protein
VSNSLQPHKEEDGLGKHVADRSESVPDDALVKSKVDAITTEFTHIMVSQLETQRAYFEKIVESHHKETEAILESTRAAWACSKKSAEAADAAAQVAESKLRQVRHKNQQLDEKLASVREEKEFLRQLNETLLANQKAFSEKLKAAQAREESLQIELADMKEQVRDLMMFIEARDTIQQAQGDQANEAVGGTLMPVPEVRRGRRNSKKK